MDIIEKKKILAKFFTGYSLNIDDPITDKLILLRDNWHKVYNENRIKLSFREAEMLANEAIIDEVLAEDF